MTVSNKQPTAVSISSIVTPSDYGQTNNCGTLLAVGGTCTVSVTFTPTAVGSRPGTLTITDNASNSPQTVNLTGTGTTLPSITGLSATSGMVGSSVTITGTGFGGSQGTSTVTFNGTAATPMTWKSTSVVVPVPTAATTGSVLVMVNGGPSNGVSFTVVPSITGLSSTSGIAGTSVTITGTGFGGLQGASTVTFLNAPAAPTNWSSTSITAPVPTGATAGTGTVTVTVGGVTSNGFQFTIVPNIANLSPASGPTGSSVTITGTNFGSIQGASTVTFNGTIAAPTSWGAGSIAVPVPAGATTGNVVVTVGGVASNGISFAVLSTTPSITGLSPTSGAVGAAVAITGTNFGSAQGTSTVIFNGTAGTPTSWSATSIQLAVPTGATTGNVVVTVTGVPSNGVSFTLLPSPSIASLSPTSGAVGASVTIVGSNFGATQGSGNVWLGSTYGVVTSWSDTQVIATVASGSQTGTAKIFQSGAWSNAPAFTVETPPPATGVILTPSSVSMVVGETRTLQAADAQGQPFQGLMWSSSDTTVASLSTDDPPIITALTPGHTTIIAGDGSTDITVYAGPVLPTGTIKWSIPGDGSGVTQILPAVPSETGVADVFALQSSGKLMAVTADGFVSWTADVGTDSKKLLPDFQGGMVLAGGQSVQELDGLTGQAKPAYSYTYPPSVYSIVGLAPTAVHTDGTIFTVDGHSLLGIDPQTGVPKFGITMEDSNYHQLPYCEFPVDNQTVSPPTVYQLMIAGDGNAYVAYSYSNQTSDPQILGDCNSGYNYRDFHLRVLRVAVDGSSQKISVGDWTQNSTCSPNANGQTVCSTEGSIPLVNGGSIITNADNGILFTWTKSTNFNSNDPVTQLTPISASGAGTTASMTGFVQPVVQQQDGTFVGTLYNTQQNLAQMISFDQAGSVKWSVTGDYQPQIATADGGVIAQNFDTGASVTFDQNGNATGQTASLPIPSWIGNDYQGTSLLNSLVYSTVNYAGSYAATAGGNPSANGTFVPVAGEIEAVPIWGLLWGGPKCALGTSQIALAGQALQQYNALKQKLLAGRYLTSDSCAAYFNADPKRASYFNNLTDAVTRQVPYDGVLSNISLYAAGEWTARIAALPTFAILKKTPVCSDFSGASKDKVIAAAQTQPPGTDVYINTSKLKKLTQSTILHEALHNLTGLEDIVDDPNILDLKGLLGIPRTSNGTEDINRILEAKGCVGTN